MIPKRHGGTDGQTTCNLITALCIASRRNNAFELNNSTNHGKITVLHIYLLPLTSLLDSHCLHYKTAATVQNAEIVHSTTAMYQ